MKMFIVDAFTERAFAGNPAAVCLLETQMDQDWMQYVASEMNLSETAFVLKQDNHYLLRWFTPKDEVDLCGHATLASAHVLWELNDHPDNTPILFQTRSGLLTASKSERLIELDFPAEPPYECPEPEQLQDGLGISSFCYIGRNRMDYFVEVDSEEIVRNLKPDFSKLSQIQTRGIIVSSKSDQAEYDFVSRCFYPAAGVNEDPVTGSAHCCMGPYWKGRLGRDKMTAFQMSERGGIVEVEVQEHRVKLAGKAVTVLRGELEVRMAYVRSNRPWNSVMTGTL